MKTNFRTLELAKALYKQCNSLSLKGAIRDQLERASLSVYLNLAEGSGKLTLKDKNRFYGIALGSLRETQAILDLVDATTEMKLADNVGASIWCLIRSQSARLPVAEPAP
ncbi:MAG: hypothetical protein B7Y39_10740 [Bdellovibrio sp. 28-41-41]|nr:MAG: hypothetical protein B7Y39_10740 [Bdellovibrio sp. 28-41-41]